MSTRKKRLNKDLDLLIGAVHSLPSSGTTSGVQSVPGTSSDSAGLRQIPLEHLQRGQYQPRTEFDPAALEELAQSIRHDGVMQPIVVRPIDINRYEIVAGERRWRACQLAGLDTIPAIVRDVSDDSAIAMALIENIQRENLNAIEEANAIKRLQVEFDLSQQQVAERVGKSRSVIANLLRLLSLESAVRALVESGELDTGHAKVLLALEGTQQVKAAKHVVNKGLSVRQTERLVKGLLDPSADDEGSAAKPDPDIVALQRTLSDKLGAAVSIDHQPKGTGRLTIAYSSLDELDGILRRIR